MPTGLSDSPLWPKNMHPLWPPEEPREKLLFPIVNLSYSLQQPTVRLPKTPLNWLWMRGRACLRPSENCTFLCRLCARFKYSQTACKTNPAGTTPTGPSSATFFPLGLLSLRPVLFSSSVCFCSLQVTCSQAWWDHPRILQNITECLLLFSWSL